MALQVAARPAQRVDAATMVSAGDASVATEGELSAIIFRRDNDVVVATSVDRGLSWGAPVRVDQDPSGSSKLVATDGGTASIAIAQGVVHAFWRDGRNQEDDLWHRRSLDGGTTWGTETRLDKGYPVGTGPVREYALTSTLLGNTANLHVLLTVDPGSRGVFLPDEIYLVSSHDNGLTWTSAQSISAANGTGTDVDSFALDAQGADLVLAWSDDRFGSSTQDDLWLRRSLDGGRTFLGPETQVDPSGPGFGDVENEIALAAEGNVLAIAWEEEFGSVREEAWVAISNDRGLSFVSRQQVGQYPLSSSDVDDVAIAVESGVVTVGWDDDRSGVEQIRVQSSSDAGLSWSSETTLSTNGGGDLRLVSGADVVLATWSGDATVGSADHVRMSCTRNAGQSWVTPLSLSSNSGDIDDARPVWNDLYGNLIVPWLADDTGTNGVWAGGCRPQSVTPINWKSGAAASLQFSGFSGQAPLVFSLGSLSPGSFRLPLALGGRDLGLLPDSTLLFTLQNPNVFGAALDSSGNGTSPMSPLSVAPGTSFTIAAFSVRFNPLAIDEITDTTTFLVQ